MKPTASLDPNSMQHTQCRADEKTAKKWSLHLCSACVFGGSSFPQLPGGLYPLKNQTGTTRHHKRRVGVMTRERTQSKRRSPTPVRTNKWGCVCVVLGIRMDGLCFRGIVGMCGRAVDPVGSEQKDSQPPNSDSSSPAVEMLADAECGAI
jgi:hypothetical protein